MKDHNFAELYADMDIDELEFALEDLNNAIENEKSWLPTCLTPESMDFVKDHIKKLKAEAAYVRKLIKELMVE